MTWSSVRIPTTAHNYVRDETKRFHRLIVNECATTNAEWTDLNVKSKHRKHAYDELLLKHCAVAHSSVTQLISAVIILAN
jgi:hypothetical protein